MIKRRALNKGNVMLKKRSLFLFAAIMLAGFSSIRGAQKVAKVSVIEGKARILRDSAENWRDARPGMPLLIGDEIYSEEESFVEIRYEIGTIVRLNENTKIILEHADAESIRTKHSLGNIWVNMKKLTKREKKFDMASPTAIASIRGTAYHMTTRADSSTDVEVFDGKVAVGPSKKLQQKIQQQKQTSPPGEPGEPVEVPGPEEVPGPYEVSLDQWMSIVAGQRITVRADGKFSKEKFELKKALGDLFIQKNQELDKKLLEE